MIPHNITIENVLAAAKEIDEKGIEWPLTKSRRYDLLIRDLEKKYPPKLIISIANKYANGDYLSHLKYNTYESQKYLQNLSSNFIIVEKTDSPISELIKKYKELLQNEGLKEESYKWQLVAQFYGKPDINAPNFEAELKAINYSNLVYKIGLGVIKHLAESKPEEYRSCFKVLFDESKPLVERIKYFDNETLKIYRQLMPQENLTHHHDERTMATFLTYHNPEKYAFYKDSFYQKYCKLLGVLPKQKGEKYLHYLELVDQLIEEYINTDAELLELVKRSLPENAYKDENHKILAQDILYQMLDKGEVIALMASDGTGWQDSHIERFKEYNATILWNSKKPSETGKALKSLRKALEENNFFYLYYSSGGKVNYRGKVIDFAVNQEELTRKFWTTQFSTILDYHSNFAEYVDGKKKASIIFLTTALEKIPPIPVSDFSFAYGCAAPRQDNLSPISEQPDFEIELDQIIQPENFNMMPNAFPLNQILFGPPGTGKTYSTVDAAAKICGFDKGSHAENKEEFNRRFDDDIFFITFHQSMAYEDFIEGIKPETTDENELRYKVVPGIFKKVAALASYEYYLNHKKRIEEAKNLIDFDDLYDSFISQLEKKLENGAVPIRTKNDFTILIKRINKNDSIITEAKDSRRKNESIPKTRLNIRKLYDKFQDISEIKQVNEIPPIINVRPGSSGYWAVFNALKNFERDEYLKLKQEGKDIDDGLNVEDILLKFEEGEFDEYVDSNIKVKPYVIIIDEINRGNVSQIFGELITLIENDKRLGKKEGLKLTLPYSRKTFAVPPNLYIIGTMNTADRSVEALDTALRRRFDFIEMPPRYNCVNEEIGTIKMRRVLEIINKRIEKLLSKDHLIGHAFFTNLTTVKEVQDTFHNKIMPLLQEYFYGDFSKIGLVLGKDFFKEATNNHEVNKDFFADFPFEDLSGIADKPVWQLKNISEMPENEFVAALNNLLPKKFGELEDATESVKEAFTVEQ